MLEVGTAEKEDETVRHISREELKEKMERGEEFFLADTLKQPYYRHAHLPGAINIPLEEIERAPEAIPDKGAEIVVYCMDPPCEISEEAARELEAMGYATNSIDQSSSSASTST